jgi:hypothetical protein
MWFGVGREGIFVFPALRASHSEKSFSFSCKTVSFSLIGISARKIEFCEESSTVESVSSAEV